MKKIIIFGIVFIFLGIIAFGISLVMLDFDFGKLDPVEAKTYELDGNFENIKINMDSTDVEILQSKDNKIRVEVTKKDVNDISVALEKDTLTIKEKDEKWYENIKFNILSSKEKVVVYLPVMALNSLDISLDTGDTKISDLKLKGYSHTASTGEISLNNIDVDWCKIVTSTGDIEIKNTNIVGDLTIEGDTCDISIDKVNVQKAAITISTGDVDLTSVNADSIRLEASTGDISLTKTVAKGEIDIETSSGEVLMSLCDGGVIRILTDTGDVECTLLTEKKVYATTDTGDIIVPNLSSDSKECVITTDTGDIKVSFAK